MKGLVKKVMMLISWLKKRKTYKEKKKLNLKNILNYIDAQYNNWKSTSNFIKPEKHIEEQSIWRLSQVKEKSPECLKDDICVQCGCSVSEETFGSLGCEYGCYPDRMDARTWEEYKKTNNIEIC